MKKKIFTTWRRAGRFIMYKACIYERIKVLKSSLIFWKARIEVFLDFIFNYLLKNTSGEDRYGRGLLNLYLLKFLQRMDFVQSLTITGYRYRAICVSSASFSYWRWRCTAVQPAMTVVEISLLRRLWSKWKLAHQRAVFISARKLMIAVIWFDKQLQRKVLRAWYQMNREATISSTSRSVLSLRVILGSCSNISMVRINPSIK